MKIYAFWDAEVVNTSDLGAVLIAEIKQIDRFALDSYIVIIDKSDVVLQTKKLPSKGDILTAVVWEDESKRIDIKLVLEDLEE